MFNFLALLYPIYHLFMLYLATHASYIMIIIYDVDVDATHTIETNVNNVFCVA